MQWLHHPPNPKPLLLGCEGAVRPFPLTFLPDNHKPLPRNKSYIINKPSSVITQIPPPLITLNPCRVLMMSIPLPLSGAVRPTGGGEPSDVACGPDAGRGGSSSPPRKVPRLAKAAPAAAAAAAGPTPRNTPPAATSRPPRSLSDLVELNVGGMLYTTSRATLEESQPQSMLAALVSGRHGPPRHDAKVRW